MAGSSWWTHPLTPHSFRVVNGYRSAYGLNVFCSVLALNALFSVLSMQSIVSLGSINSCFSVFSINSFLAVGCMNGAFEICLEKPHYYWVTATALFAGYVGAPRPAATPRLAKCRCWPGRSTPFYSGRLWGSWVAGLAGCLAAQQPPRRAGG